jgi:hypothetical protein
MARALAFLMGRSMKSYRLFIGINDDSYLKGKSDLHRDALGKANKEEGKPSDPLLYKDRYGAVCDFLDGLQEHLPSRSLFDPGEQNRSPFSVSEKGEDQVGAGPVTKVSLSTPKTGHVWACIDEYAKPGKRFAEDLALGVLYVPVLSHHSTTKLLR